MLRLLTFASPGELRLGALLGDDVIDLNRSNPLLPNTLYGLLVGGEATLELARATVARIAVECAADRPALERAGKIYGTKEVLMMAPLLKQTRNIFCVGRNYFKHLEEGAREHGVPFTPLQYPEFFSKPPTTVVGPNAVFPLNPHITSQLDYEVELAVIIGRHGREIPRERAYDHVFGFTVANDLSARDQQARHGQWFKGKGLDNSCPLGPVVVPLQDIGDPQTLTLRLSVNGEVRQNASTAGMTWPVPDLIYWLSQGTTLEPGDIILTGTPEGVGAGRTPQKFLQAGDVVEAELVEIGTPLRTYIVEA